MSAAERRWWHTRPARCLAGGLHASVAWPRGSVSRPRDAPRTGRRQVSMSFAGPGSPSRKPWPSRSPCFERASWPSSSIPSATTVSESARPTPRIASSRSRLWPAVVERRHEAPVDLEDVHGHALQLGQGRVAGAEVVDRDAHAERLERLAGARTPRPRRPSASSRSSRASATTARCPTPRARAGRPRRSRCGPSCWAETFTEMLIGQAVGGPDGGLPAGLSRAPSGRSARSSRCPRPAG